MGAWDFITSGDATWSRRRVFLYEVVVLAALLVLAVLYVTDHLERVPAELGGMPVGVPYFGALGAVLISLTGVFDHRGQNWDTSWETWHYSRWLVGATVALIAYLIFKAGLLSLQLQPEDADNNILYYLIAFAVGYREATFRELMKRLVEVVLTPGTRPPTISGVHPPGAPMAGGATVSITGTHLSTTHLVRFGDSPATILQGQGLGPSGNLVSVTVPPSTAKGKVPLVVQTTEGSTAATFEYV